MPRARFEADPRLIVITALEGGHDDRVAGDHGADAPLADGRTAPAERNRTAGQTEPWSESANRILLEIHARRGDPGSALRRYEKFSGILLRELGVPPAPDSRR
ncbi:bacterial transcriptional activator domain-containing protein [Nonomuraea spiralis]|uniref:bacterial transcriptional activator domain-containing protein n=1 Tax=Nonomuraea spiralis TaxID=46182 RepID=UPI0037A71EA7